MSNALKELEEAGFIAKVPFWKKKNRDSVYRLIDEYTLFYLQWIEPIKSQINLDTASDYWLKKMHTPAWNAWSGYSFEAVCLKHINKIKQALGFEAVSSIQSSWHYNPKEPNAQGTQIDLIIERADRTINLCEIKSSTEVYRVSKEYQSK